MGNVVKLPTTGLAMLADARSQRRTMRVSYHDEGQVFVLSLWRDDTCTSTFRLDRDDVPALVSALVTGLAKTGRARVGRTRVG